MSYAIPRIWFTCIFTIKCWIFYLIYWFRNEAVTFRKKTYHFGADLHNTQKKVVDDDEGPGRQIISLSLYYAIRRITNFPSLSSDYFLHYIRLKYLLLHSFAFPFHHTTLYFPNRIPCKNFFASAQLFKKIFYSFPAYFAPTIPISFSVFLPWGSALPLYSIWARQIAL